jgi:hypothetical protein
MYANLEMDKAIRRSETHCNRKIFMIRLKKVLQDLPDTVFRALCRECLHREHFPALEDYLYYSDMEIADIKKAEKRRAAYMTKMFRKTLTLVLVDLEEAGTGYSPYTLEWLIIHKHWNTGE